MLTGRSSLALLGALLLAFPGVAHSASAAPSPSAAPGDTAAPAAQSSVLKHLLQESGSPIEDQGSNYNYRSYVTRVVPHVPGLSLEVLEFADRLILTNHTGRTVTVYGYQEEPYARVLADGAVEVNVRSPAYYLDQSFYGTARVPPSASPTATPEWVTIDRTAQLEWHDHRIHWPSPIPPAQVKDKRKRTLIFQWEVPIRIGAQRGAIFGNLFWVPLPDSSAPVGAIVALVALTVLGLIFVLYARKRRARRPPGAGAGSAAAGPGGRGSREETPVGEAW